MGKVKGRSQTPGSDLKTIITINRESKCKCYYEEEEIEMKPMRCEREVHINFCVDEESATLYTSYPAWIRKMDKLVAKNPQEFKCIAENEISKTYTMPKNFISIRSKKRTVTLSERQKAQATKRLHSLE